MYRMPVIIGKISPDRANWTPTSRLLHGYLPKREKITSHSVSFYNLSVTIRSVDQQRNNLPKKLTLNIL